MLWPAERFRAHGIAYEICETTKSDLYRDLLPLLNAGRAELLDHPRLVAQLCNLERRTARGGKDSIDHAPNAHDDVANAVAGAVVAASQGALSMDAVPMSVWEEALDAASRYRYWPPPFREGQIFPRFP
jgi:hypothetical protein